MKPITLKLRRSNILMLVFLTAGLFFSAMLLLIKLPLLPQIILVCLLLLGIAFFIRHIALLNLPSSWQVVMVNKAGECCLSKQNGTRIRVKTMADSFVSSYLTLLHCVPVEFVWFKVWQHAYVILVADNCDVDSFRQLRVYLRWHKSVVRGQAKMQLDA